MGNETDGRTSICGLIGNPVEHTMSPVIHNSLAEMFGDNLVYVPFHVKEDLRAAVEGAYSLNILGLNVTVPYKTQVMEYIKEVDEKASQIGAVNTLVRTESGFKGFNTDMPGLYRAMQEDGVEIAGESIMVLGAGGVARAVAMLAAQKRAKQIRILNRTAEKAKQLAEEVKAFYPEADITAHGVWEYETLEGNMWTAIQATSVGMYPHQEQTLIEEKAFYQKIKAGYDLIFNPVETKFMHLVTAAGGEAFNGLKMLLYQGIIAYELWNDVKVTKEQAAEIYKKMKGRL